jgi:hypothetical protein
MAKEAEIKTTIYAAIQQAHITQGKQAPGDRLWVGNEDYNVLGDAVFEALQKAGMLNLD